MWTAGASNPATVIPTSTPNSQSLMDNSITGQTVRFYDSVGRSVDVDIRWAKTGSSSAGTTWAMYASTSANATGAQASWTKAATATFNSAGQLTPAALLSTVDLSSRGLGTISFDLGGGKLTQYDDATGQALVQYTQDGYGTGTFSGVSISDDGTVVASFTNGKTQPLAEISIAQFNAPDMLKRENGSAFAETLESGVPLYGAGDTTVQAGLVEGSNTDIAEEFSKMIITQQAYSANTRVITTSQDMLKELVNVIR